MQRKRGELGPIGEALADLDGPVKALREASPQARHHFTRFDQVDQLVRASEIARELRAIHSSRARLRLTHLCRADQPIHVRTVVSSTLEISPVAVVLLWCCRAASRTDRRAPRAM